MPQVKASRDQFVVDDDKVIHLPTGTIWTAHAGDPQLAALFMGRLGEVLESGDEYDRRDTHEFALRLLAERIKRR